LGGFKKMSTEIYYFTGTGNSLSAARDIADEIGDAKLISIPEVFDRNFETEASNVGFIFPVYMWGIPHMVLEFIRKLKFSKDSYIFAVATCAGQPGETLIQLQKLLQEKDKDLNAGFAVKEAANTIQKNNIFINMAMVIEPNEKITESFKNRLPEIIDVIGKQKGHKAETSSRMLNIYGRWIYSMAMPRINTMGQFYTDDNCNLCLNCQRICPSDNIQIVNDKTTWNQHCEFCQACVQWCPREAIHIKNEDPSRRYHNSQIKVKDLILR
jgi:Pyruvate/2-oxoacid:ferredoxin oxidoreductase delta subunit/flavodoxin